MNVLLFDYSIDTINSEILSKITPTKGRGDMGELWIAFKRHRRSELASILGGALAILGLLAPFLIDNITPKWTSKEFVAIFIALLFLLLGDRISNFFRSIENSQALTEMMEAIKIPMAHAIECRHMGTYVEALEYLKTRLPYAEFVKDVTVSYGISDRELQLFFYKEDESNLLTNVIAKFVSDGGIWRGILSSNLLNVTEQS